MALYKEEYIPAPIPEKLSINGKTYVTDELLNYEGNPTLYIRQNKTWVKKNVVTTRYKPKEKFVVCDPAPEYRATPGSEYRYQQWWDCLTMDTPTFLRKYSEYNAYLLNQRRAYARTKLTTDKNFSAWLHLNKLV